MLSRIFLSSALLKRSSRNFFVDTMSLYELGPPTQPPSHAIPSMKFSGSLPAFMRRSAFLHSAAPFALQTLQSTSSPFSFMLSITAAVTPPEFAKRLPYTEPSWYEVSSASSCTPFAFIIARISLKVST